MIESSDSSQSAFAAYRNAKPEPPQIIYKQKSKKQKARKNTPKLKRETTDLKKPMPALNKLKTRSSKKRKMPQEDTVSDEMEGEDNFTASSDESKSCNRVDGMHVKPVKKLKKQVMESKLENKKEYADCGNVKTSFIKGPDSVENGRQMFSWISSPVEASKFFKQNWEIRPLHIARHCATYYSTLLSSEGINHILREKNLYFGKNIDVTSYSGGKRETHNPGGRAHAPVVWDYYSNGCSIRLLNPQTFFKKMHVLNATLQEYFGCLVGANVYMTPPGTQGFAPHYDDIEAFVLQVEGRKLWKLYPPRCHAEVLPRESSGNFTESDLGPPIMEVTLEAGDMLYFPRGIIHQGRTLEDAHSLHITLSMYQKNSWADLLEKLMPAALKVAIESDSSFRRGLPMHYLSHMGLVHSDETSKHRSQFVDSLQKLVTKLITYAPIDAAVDQLGKQFIHDSLPPVLKKSEVSRSVFGDGEVFQNGKVMNQAEIGLDTRVKLLRYNCLRVVTEEDSVRIYYSVNNSREYHGEEPQCLEIDETVAPAVDALIQSYPKYMCVEDFPLASDIEKVQIASDLWENGLLLTEESLGYTSE